MEHAEHFPSNPTPQASRIEREAEVDLVPGTEVMTDMGGARFDSGNQDSIVLIPQPTDDPQDPLVSITQSSCFSYNPLPPPLPLSFLDRGPSTLPNCLAFEAKKYKSISGYKLTWFSRTGVPCGKPWLLPTKASS
jgi:hypothetical protein